MSKADTNIHLGMGPTPRWAFSEYERVRHRLPAPPTHAVVPEQVPSLAVLEPFFDAFIFDAFGVLNIGEQALPGALARVEHLLAINKRCLILSNAATASTQALLLKYQTMGFALKEDQLISSRWLLEESLETAKKPGLWGVIAPLEANPQTLPVNYTLIQGRPDAGMREQMDRCDGFVLLSSQGWDTAHQALLEASLAEYPRPVEVANPDIVAPRATELSLEPGFFAHRLADKTGVTPVFYGKPFLPAYHAALDRLEGIPRDRILMVGDTLHTDILGGQNAGVQTLLVTAHGALKGLDVATCMQRSGIYPHYIAPEI